MKESGGRKEYEAEEERGKKWWSKGPLAFLPFPSSMEERPMSKEKAKGRKDDE